MEPGHAACLHGRIVYQPLTRLNSLYKAGFLFFLMKRRTRVIRGLFVQGRGTVEGRAMRIRAGCMADGRNTNPEKTSKWESTWDNHNKHWPSEGRELCYWKKDDSTNEWGARYAEKNTVPEAAGLPVDCRIGDEIVPPAQVGDSERIDIPWQNKSPGGGKDDNRVYHIVFQYPIECQAGQKFFIMTGGLGIVSIILSPVSSLLSYVRIFVWR